MLNAAKTSFHLWLIQIQRYVRTEFIDLDPHEYCIVSVFVIAIGAVMLSGRR